MSRVFRTAAKTARAKLPVALLGCLMILSLSAYAGLAARSRPRTPKLSLRAASPRVKVASGSTARYRIVIRRSRWRGVVTLRVTRGLPRLARVRFVPKRTRGSVSTLTVTTSAGTAGTFRLRVRGTGRAGTATIVLTLKVVPPTRSRGTGYVTAPPFTISGDVGDLQPGVLSPLDLRLTNPNPLPLTVTLLTVSLQRVSAPYATPSLPCTLADFALQQLSGAYPLRVPAASTTSLGALGLSSAQWPQVAIIDRSTNQDGCRGATVTLGYAAAARLG